MRVLCPSLGADATLGILGRASDRRHRGRAFLPDYLGSRARGDRRGCRQPRREGSGGGRLSIRLRAFGLLSMSIIGSAHFPKRAGPHGPDTPLPTSAAAAARLLLLHRRGSRQAADPRHLERGQYVAGGRSEEHTSELQALMRISYAVFCLKKKTPQ